MFFFCKPKTVILDAFTCNHGLAELVPPAPASKFRPKWFYEVSHDRDIKTDTGITIKGNTIRRCQGFKDYYSDRAIIIPLWSSFILEYDANGSRSIFSDNKISSIEYQSPELRGNKYLMNYHHFKIMSPWRIKEKFGINFMFSQPFYNFQDPTEFIMPPAVINYKHQHSSEVNFFVKKPTAGILQRLSFEAGQPLIHLNPMTDKKVIIKSHEISKEEWDKVRIPQLFTNGIYAKVKKLGYGK